VPCSIHGSTCVPSFRRYWHVPSRSLYDIRQCVDKVLAQTGLFILIHRKSFASDISLVSFQKRKSCFGLSVATRQAGALFSYHLRFLSLLSKVGVLKGIHLGTGRSYLSTACRGEPFLRSVTDRIESMNVLAVACRVVWNESLFLFRRRTMLPTLSSLVWWPRVSRRQWNQNSA
jgi:hypothetical protein